jgi:uncharacterized membrane protein YdjX (TVP38/TMEM64 family)
VTDTDAVQKTQGGGWRAAALLAIVVAAALATWQLGIGDRLAGLKTWIEGLGPLAPSALVLLRAVADVAVVPGSALNTLAGLLFNPTLAVICMSIGGTLGACASFLIARYFARESVARWLKRHEKHRKFDEMVGRNGALVVALARFIPVIPFNMQSYAFGLTQVRFGTFVFWSWLCMLPGTILVVVGANIVSEALESGEVPWVLVGVLGSSLAVMVGLGAYTLIRLGHQRGEDASPEAAPE